MESANPKRWNRLRVEYDNIGFFSWLLRKKRIHNAVSCSELAWTYSN